MKSINFNEGIREYMINGDESRVIRIRIDPDMVKRFEETADDIDELIGSVPDSPDVNTLSKMGEKLCGIINKAFGTDVCTSAFGGANPFTPVSGGKPLYQAFLEALMPAVEADIKALTMTREADAPKLRPEVKKYLSPTLPAETAKMPDLSGLSKEEKITLLAQLLS